MYSSPNLHTTLRQRRNNVYTTLYKRHEPVGYIDRMGNKEVSLHRILNLSINGEIAMINPWISDGARFLTGLVT